MATVNISVHGNTTPLERDIQAAVQRASRVQLAPRVNGRQFTQPLGRMTGAANEFTKSLEASNARVIAFGASVAIINGVQNAFAGLVRTTIELEKTMADIGVVMDSTQAELEQFGKGLFGVAKNTAQAFNTVAEAALEFSRQGLSMEETLTRTNDALILTRLTGLKAAEAVMGLTAAINSFNNAGLTTTDIINKMAAVDVKFAVSSEDLIHALERTGAVAIGAGVEIDKLMALVTSLQQTTARGGAVIGNGLKTIFTRIQRPYVINQLKEMDIAVTNLSGTTLSADQILVNLAQSFDGLSQAQQSNTIQMTAGIFQANIMRALMADLKRENSLYAQATRTSADAADDAIQKNEKLNQTIAALSSQTLTSIKELADVVGSIMFAPGVRDILELTKGLAENLRSALGDGEDEGYNFGRSLLKGVGNIIMGPGLALFAALFAKLLVTVTRFAAQSARDILGVTTQKEKLRQTEEAIINALNQNRNLQTELLRYEGNRVAQEKIMLGVIQEQTAAMQMQKSLAATIAPKLIKAGVNPQTMTVNVKGGGAGGAPKASGVVPDKKERSAANRAGYSPGALKTMVVPNLGPVTYNSAETVKTFPGMSQPAIMPPKQSRAGVKYSRKFADRHGFNPYASGGMIPNFNRKKGPPSGTRRDTHDALVKQRDQAAMRQMMELYRNPGNFAGPRTGPQFGEWSQKNFGTGLGSDKLARLKAQVDAIFASGQKSATVGGKNFKITGQTRENFQYHRNRRGGIPADPAASRTMAIDEIRTGIGAPIIRKVGKLIKVEAALAGLGDIARLRKAVHVGTSKGSGNVKDGIPKRPLSERVVDSAVRAVKNIETDDRMSVLVRPHSVKGLATGSASNPAMKKDWDAINTGDNRAVGAKFEQFIQKHGPALGLSPGLPTGKEGPFRGKGVAGKIGTMAKTMGVQTEPTRIKNMLKLLRSPKNKRDNPGSEQYFIDTIGPGLALKGVQGNKFGRETVAADIGGEAKYYTGFTDVSFMEATLGKSARMALTTGYSNWQFTEGVKHLRDRVALGTMNLYAKDFSGYKTKSGKPGTHWGNFGRGRKSILSGLGYAEGLIPNFGSIEGGVMTLDKAPMHLMGISSFVNDAQIRKVVETGSSNVNVKLSTLSKFFPELRELMAALEARGVTNIQRQVTGGQLSKKAFRMSSQKTSSKDPGGFGAAGGPVEIQAQKDLAALGKTTIATSHNFASDLIEEGARPREIKSGTAKAPGIMMKNLSLVDQDFFATIRKYFGRDGLMGYDPNIMEKANTLKAFNFRNSVRELEKRNLVKEGASTLERMRGVRKYRLAEGLVPNYSKKSQRFEARQAAKYRGSSLDRKQQSQAAQSEQVQNYIAKMQAEFALMDKAQKEAALRQTLSMLSSQGVALSTGAYSQAMQAGKKAPVPPPAQQFPKLYVKRDGQFAPWEGGPIAAEGLIPNYVMGIGKVAKATDQSRIFKGMQGRGPLTYVGRAGDPSLAELHSRGMTVGSTLDQWRHHQQQMRNPWVSNIDKRQAFKMLLTDDAMAFLEKHFGVPSALSKAVGSKVAPRGEPGLGRVFDYAKAAIVGRFEGGGRLPSGHYGELTSVRGVMPRVDMVMDDVQLLNSLPAIFGNKGRTNIYTGKEVTRDQIGEAINSFVHEVGGHMGQSAIGRMISPRERMNLMSSERQSGITDWRQHSQQISPQDVRAQMTPAQRIKVDKKLDEARRHYGDEKWFGSGYEKTVGHTDKRPIAGFSGPSNVPLKKNLGFSSHVDDPLRIIETVPHLLGEFAGLKARDMFSWVPKKSSTPHRPKEPPSAIGAPPGVVTVPHLNPTMAKMGKVISRDAAIRQLKKKYGFSTREAKDWLKKRDKGETDPLFDPEFAKKQAKAKASETDSNDSIRDLLRNLGIKAAGGFVPNYVTSTPGDFWSRNLLASHFEKSFGLNKQQAWEMTKMAPKLYPQASAPGAVMEGAQLMVRSQPATQGMAQMHNPYAAWLAELKTHQTGPGPRVLGLGMSTFLKHELKQLDKLGLGVGYEYQKRGSWQGSRNLNLPPKGGDIFSQIPEYVPAEEAIAKRKGMVKRYKMASLWKKMGRWIGGGKNAEGFVPSFSKMMSFKKSPAYGDIMGARGMDISKGISPGVFQGLKGYKGKPLLNQDTQDFLTKHFGIPGEFSRMVNVGPSSYRIRTDMMPTIGMTASEISALNALPGIFKSGKMPKDIGRPLLSSAVETMVHESTHAHQSLMHKLKDPRVSMGDPMIARTPAQAYTSPGQIGVQEVMSTVPPHLQKYLTQKAEQYRRLVALRNPDSSKEWAKGNRARSQDLIARFKAGEFPDKDLAKILGGIGQEPRGAGYLARPPTGKNDRQALKEEWNSLRRFETTPGMLGQAGKMKLDQMLVARGVFQRPTYRAAGLVPNFVAGRYAKPSQTVAMHTPANKALQQQELSTDFLKMAERARNQARITSDPEKAATLLAKANRLESMAQAVKSGKEGAGFGFRATAGAGLVPNFANPLSDAVGREAAAGVPRSMIRVSQSNRLRGPLNPRGLAVTNTRDEALGVNQGIDRAIAMGVDPKTHGAARGMFPNFAEPMGAGAADSAAQLKASESMNRMFMASMVISMFAGQLQAAGGKAEKFGDILMNVGTAYMAFMMLQQTKMGSFLGKWLKGGMMQPGQRGMLGVPRWEGLGRKMGVASRGAIRGNPTLGGAYAMGRSRSGVVGGALTAGSYMVGKVGSKIGGVLGKAVPGLGAGAGGLKAAAAAAGPLVGAFAAVGAAGYVVHKTLIATNKSYRKAMMDSGAHLQAEFGGIAKASQALSNALNVVSQSMKDEAEVNEARARSMADPGDLDAQLALREKESALLEKRKKAVEELKKSANALDVGGEDASEEMMAIKENQLRLVRDLQGKIGEGKVTKEEEVKLREEVSKVKLLEGVTGMLVDASKSTKSFEENSNAAGDFLNKAVRFWSFGHAGTREANVADKQSMKRMEAVGITTADDETEARMFGSEENSVYATGFSDMQKFKELAISQALNREEFDQVLGQGNAALDMQEAGTYGMGEQFVRLTKDAMELEQIGMGFGSGEVGKEKMSQYYRDAVEEFGLDAVLLMKPEELRMNKALNLYRDQVRHFNREMVNAWGEFESSETISRAKRDVGFMRGDYARQQAQRMAGEFATLPLAQGAERLQLTVQGRRKEVDERISGGKRIYENLMKSEEFKEAPPGFRQALMKNFYDAALGGKDASKAIKPLTNFAKELSERVKATGDPNTRILQSDEPTLAIVEQAIGKVAAKHNLSTRQGMEMMGFGYYKEADLGEVKKRQAAINKESNKTKRARLQTELETWKDANFQADVSGKSGSDIRAPLQQLGVFTEGAFDYEKVIGQTERSNAVRMQAVAAENKAAEIKLHGQQAIDRKEKDYVTKLTEAIGYMDSFQRFGYDVEQIGKSLRETVENWEKGFNEFTLKDMPTGGMGGIPGGMTVRSFERGLDLSSQVRELATIRKNQKIDLGALDQTFDQFEGTSGGAGILNPYQGFDPKMKIGTALAKKGLENEQDKQEWDNKLAREKLAQLGIASALKRSATLAAESEHTSQLTTEKINTEKTKMLIASGRMAEIGVSEVRAQSISLKASNEKLKAQLKSGYLATIADDTAKQEELNLRKTIEMVKGKVRYLSNIRNASNMASLTHQQEKKNLEASILLTTAKINDLSIGNNLSNLARKQLESENKNAQYSNLIAEEKVKQYFLEGESTKQIEGIRNSRISALGSLADAEFMANQDRGTDATIEWNAGIAQQTGDNNLSAAMFQQRMAVGSENSGESLIKYWEGIAAINQEMGTGTQVMDTMRIKSAEAYARMEDFNSTFTSALWESAREGMTEMLTDMVSGATEAKEALHGFVTKIARTIQEQIIGNAVDQMMAGLSTMFGIDMLSVEQKQLGELQQIRMLLGGDNLGPTPVFHEGGLVGFQRGGSTAGDVPAMLTSGEYVLRKEVVDRIGSGALEEMNEGGKLPALQELANGGYIPSPAPGRQGGMRHKEWMDLWDRDPGNEVFDKRHAQRYDKPGYWDKWKAGATRTQAAGSEGKFASGFRQFTGGLGTAAGTYYGAEWARGMFDDDEDEDDSNKPAKLIGLSNLPSTIKLDLDTEGLSSRTLSQRSEVGEQSQYLINEAEKRIARQNEKAMKRAAFWGNIAGAGLMMGAKMGMGAIDKHLDKRDKINFWNENPGERAKYDWEVVDGEIVKRDFAAEFNRGRNFGPLAHTVGGSAPTAPQPRPSPRPAPRTPSRRPVPAKAPYTRAPRTRISPIEAMNRNRYSGRTGPAAHSSSTRRGPSTPASAFTPPRRTSTRISPIEAMNRQRYQPGPSHRFSATTQKAWGSRGTPSSGGGHRSTGSQLNSMLKNPRKWRSELKSLRDTTDSRGNAKYDPALFEGLRLNAGGFLKKMGQFIRGGPVSKSNMSNATPKYFYGGNVNRDSSTRSNSNIVSRIKKFFYGGSTSKAAQSTSTSSISSRVKKFFYGGSADKNSVFNYQDGGAVAGPGGIDNVGPVMLDAGEFVIRASSVKKLNEESPGFLSALNKDPSLLEGIVRKREGGIVNFQPTATRHYQDGGLVSQLSRSPETTVLSPNETNSSAVSNNNVNNININITMGAQGEAEANVEGVNEAGKKERELATKIKGVVLQVINDEQRVGGSLRR